MGPPLFFLSADARILRELREGNEDVLTELFDANRRMVRSYVVANRGSADDADDLLQEAIVILWERVRKGTFAHKSRLSTFLFGIVRNLWLRRLARARKEPPMDPSAPDPADDTPGILDRLIGEEETDAVRLAMSDLGKQCRKLLLLFYWEERSTEEIALAMGFANADVVKSKKYQCRKSLEDLVRQKLGTT